jgi:N-acetyl-anhydromuramyl-L-alanine amidase AmpD
MQFDSNGWLDVATEIDYSANSMDRQGYDIRYVVLHGTAGGSSASGIGQYFQTTQGGSNPVSSHLIIDQAGNIVQGVPLSLAAWGNGILTQGHASYLPDSSINPNLYTASIEFVKASTDNSDILTPIQALTGFQVVQCICDTYGVPKQPGNIQGGIIQHADIDPVNRSRCPGPFPLDELFTYLKGASMIIPQGWSYNSSTKVLTAPNNHTIRQGNAQFVLLSPAWDTGNVPLEEEHGVPGGTAQLFRDSELAWDAKDGVHYAPIGLLYQAAEAQITALQTQVTTLQKEVAAIPVNITQLANQVAAVLLQLQQYNKLIAADITAAQAVLQAIAPSSS